MATRSQISRTSSTVDRGSRTSKTKFTGVNLIGKLLVQDVPFFPMLAVLERKYLRHFVFGHVVLSALQIIGLGAVPHYQWGMPMQGLFKALWFFQLPIWDNTHINAGFTPCFAIAWVPTLMCLMLWALIANFVTAEDDTSRELLRARVRRAAAAGLHALTGPLAVPILHLYLAQAYCKGDTNQLYWFPDTACDSPLGITAKVSCIIGFVVFLPLVYINVMYIRDTNVASRHHWARSHSRLDSFFLGYRILSVILFHYFASDNRLQWYGVFQVLASFAMASAYIMLLPYFRIKTQQFRVVSLLLGTTYASLGALSFHDDVRNEFKDRNVDIIVIAATIFPLLWIFSKLALIRTSRFCVNALEALKEGQLIDSDPLFPAFLPERDTSFPLASAIQKDIMGEHNADSGDKEFNFLTPYVSCAYFVTDAELSTRFLLYYTKITRLPPTSSMLAFCARIYSKFMLKYPYDHTVTMSFAIFLFHTASRPKFSLEVLSQLDAMDVPAHVRYHAYRLYLKLVDVLNIHSASHSDTLQRSKKRHKDALVHMSEFWTYLCADEVDTHQLAYVAKCITAAREDGLGLYQRAINRNANNTELICCYAVFLQDVMFDEDGSAQCKVVLEENREKKKIRAMRGAKSGAMNVNETFTQLPVSQVAENDSHASALVNRFFNIMSAFAAALLLGMAVFIIIAILLHQNQSAEIDRLHSAGLVRALSQRGAYVAQQIFELRLNSTQANRLRREILGVQKDFRTHHNLLTYGTSRTSYGPHVTFFKNPAQTIRSFTNQTSFTDESTDLWTIGNLLAHIFGETGKNPESKHLSFLQYNGPRSIALAFNRSMYFYEQEHSQNIQGSLVAYSAMFVIIIGIISAISILLVTNFNRLHQSQMDVYRLFTFIPRTMLTSLQASAKQRVVQHDQFLGMKSKEMVESLIGKEEDQRTDAEIAAGLSAHSEVQAVNPHRPSISDTKPAVPVQQNQQNQQQGAVTEHIPPPQDRQKKTDTSLGSSGITLSLSVFCGLIIFIFALLTWYFEGYAISTAQTKISIIRQVDFQSQRAADMVALAQQLTQFGETELYWGTYRALSNQRSFDILESDIVSTSVTTSELDKFSKLRLLEDYLRNTEASSLVLMHSGYNKPADVMKEILYHSWNKIDNIVTLKETNMFQRTSDMQLTDRVSDLALPKETQKLLARQVLFADEYLEKQQSFLDLLKELKSDVSRRLDSKYEENINTLRGVIAGGVLSCTVCFILLAYTFHQRQNLSLFQSNTVSTTLLISLCIVLCSAGLYFGIAAGVVRGPSGDNVGEAYDRVRDVFDHKVHFETQLDRFVKLPRAFCQSGDMYRYVEYQDWISNGGINELLQSVQALSYINSTLVAKNVQKITNYLNDLRYLQNISMRIAGWSYNTNKLHMLELSNFTWDITKEKDYLQTKSRWPNEVYRYTNTQSDAALGSSFQAEVARRAVFSPRFLSIENNLRSVASDTFDNLQSVKSRDATTVSNYSYNLILACIVVSCMAPISSLAVFWVLMNRYFLLTNTTSTNISKEGDGESSQTKTTRKCLLALLFLAIVCTAGAGVALSSALTSSEQAKLLNYASAREFLVAQSMVWTNMMANDPTMIPDGRLKLQDIVRDIKSARNALYFGEQYGTYATVGKDGTQDSLLFDSNSYSSRRYSACNATQDEVAIGTLSRGVALLYEGTWLKTLNLLATSPTVENVGMLRAQLRALAGPLLDGLRASTERYEDSFRSQVQNFSNIVVIIFAVGIGVLLLEYIFIFKPVVQQLVREEDGTKLMLGMIPKDVVDRIPEIAEYLETGNMAGDESQELADALSDMSTVPVIAIDSKGIILKFSQAAEKTFGYTASEVTGMNIKVLMPNEIARNHDQFLANYRRTGVKHVIDRVRRLKAVRKNGQVFHIELNVREYLVGDDSVYISFCKDLTDEMAVQAEDALNKYVCDITTTPIVAIDSIGTVILTNNALTRVFGYSSEEVIGENVKILMSSEIAVNHDGYLAAYKRTGIAKIIDKVNRLTAQRKNGELFSIDLTVREIKMQGTDSMFVAYARDVTDEHRAEMQNEVNDIIANLSPIPIIAINEKGVLLKFSRAAAQVFGYSQDEVIKRRMNVSMLMPDEVAVNHDSYLQRYLTTGVKRVVDQKRDIVCKRRGGFFPATLTVKEVRKDGTNPVFLSYLQECTQQKQMEREHHIGESVRDQSLLAIITITTKGVIKEFNPMAETLFGWTRKEIVGLNISLLTPPNVAREHDSYLKRYSRQANKTLQRSVTAKTKDGKFIPVEIAVREVPGNDLYEDTYVGYIRSTLAEKKLMQAFLINEALTNLSTIPIIAMNGIGTVLRFSAAAEECWGFTADDVIGQNVKMLMPPNIAVNHDGFLSRYRDTKVKHVIDTTRRVLGMRKNGNVFPLEISVREIVKDGQENTFVAYLRDLTEETTAVQEKELGLTISQLSTIALVQCDDVGKILFVNTAACKEFGWTSEELIGENVKVLMQPDIAVVHDSFLSNYKRTQVARIVGSTRRIPAMRKDGTIFQVEIKLAESKSSIEGRSTTFVAYLRNIATQLRLEEANGLIDAITNLSSVPVIAIDCRGVLIKFSSAAEKVFGYESAEVLGENVRMLMPDEVAEKHDQYLRNYTKTRIKTVVDSIRRLEAKRKNGTFFLAELAVKELAKEGRESMFVAYCRDASEDLALEKAVELSEMVTKMGTVPMLCITSVGKITKLNTATTLAFGYSQQELLGQNVKMLMPPEIAANHDQFLETYSRTGVKNVIDSTRTIKGQRKSGQTFPCEITVKEIVSQSGEKIFIGFLRDITQDLLVQQANSVNDAVSDMSFVPLVVINSVGTVARFSPSAENTFGYKAEEILGKNISMMMPKEHAEKHDGYLAKFAKTGVGKVVDQTNTLPVIHKNGTEILCEVNVKQVKKDGEETMFIGFLKDATVEARIKLQKGIADSVVAVSTIPMIQINIEGTVLRFNASATDVFGYTEKEVLGQNIKILMPKEIADNHDNYLSTFKRTGVKHVIDTTRVVNGKKKNGQIFPAEVSVREIVIGEGKPNLYTGMIRDLTQQYILQQAVAINDATLDLSITPLIVINSRGIILKFSKAAQHEFQYMGEEAIGKNINMLLPEPHRSQHDDYLKRYLETHEKHVVGRVTRNLFGVRKNGTQFPVEVAVSEITKEGMEKMFLGTVRNIEDEMRQSNQNAMNDCLHEISPLPLIFIDEKGICLRFNTAAEDFLGYKKDEVIGKNIKMIMPAEIGANHDAFLQRYLETNVKRVVDTVREVIARKKNGAQVPVQIGVREVKAGNRRLFLAYLDDLASKGYSLYAAEMSSVLQETIKTPIIIMNDRGIIQRVNKAAEKCFEFTTAQMVGKNVKLLMPEKYQQHHDGYLMKYKQTREKHIIDTTRSIEAETKAGVVFPADIMVKELRQQDGSSLYIGFIVKK